MRRSIPMDNRLDGGSFQGPLMTDHLQDLDLELQLLKRKRQMIEQQHQELISRQGQRGYMFDQPHTYNAQPYDYEEQQEFNSLNAYPHMYTDRTGRSSLNQFGNQFGRKRQVESPWDNGAPPPPSKRFSGPKGKFPKKPFGDRSSRSMNRTPEPMGRRPQPQTLKSLMSLKPKPAPAQPNFKPSKVAKPKPAATKKLASYPIVERKKLVAEASNLVSATSGNVLSADRVPSQQMTGRLELALGSILKDLKTKYKKVQPHAASFQSAHLQKVMKQFIRERIRSVMLGNAVGNVVDILFKYRKVFPTSTDKDILQAALDAQEVLDTKKFGIKLVEAENPEEYFSINMQKVIDFTLNEMFSKLHQLYNGEESKDNSEDVSQKNDHEESDTSIVVNSKEVDDISKDNDENKADETTTGNDTNKADETVTSNDTSKADETTTVNDINNVNGTISENNANDLGQTTSENEVNEATDPDGNNAHDSDKINDESTVDDASKVDDSDAAKSVSATDQQTITHDYKVMKHFKVFKPNSPESRHCEQFIENVMKRRMPKILRKHIPVIIKLLNLNQMYKTASAAIIQKSVQKAEKLKVQGKDTNKSSSANTTVGEDGNNSNVKEVKESHPLHLRYYVKIIARPTLPRRKLMQAFLNNYNPKTIKKHKHMHSLLFVGFSNKEDFKKILAASGTVIGRSTLVIKVSEKANDKRTPATQVQDLSEVKDEPETANPIADTSSDSLMGTELDEKITDLLSSIRKAEEECYDAKTTSTVAQPVATTIDNNGMSEVVSLIEEKTSECEKENAIVKNEETGETSQTIDEKADVDKAIESVEIKQEPQTEDVDAELNTIEKKDEASDKVEALKNDAKASGRATPTRTSSRLTTVTPSTIRTRRASRLAQNNP